jgi:hypothetical protein
MFYPANILVEEAAKVSYRRFITKADQERIKSFGCSQKRFEFMTRIYLLIIYIFFRET